MTPGERRRLILAVALLVSLVAYVVVNFRVTTDIGEFLPDREDGELARLSREIADSELSRTMILAVEGPDTRRRFARAVPSRPSCAPIRASRTRSPSSRPARPKGSIAPSSISTSRDDSPSSPTTRRRRAHSFETTGSGRRSDTCETNWRDPCHRWCRGSQRKIPS